jgi:hypothetical protein
MHLLNANYVIYKLVEINSYVLIELLKKCRPVKLFAVESCNFRHVCILIMYTHNLGPWKCVYKFG